MEFTPGRIVATIIGLAYVFVMLFGSGATAALQCLVALTIPLGCILFSEELGDYVGYAGHGAITTSSPATMVACMGWVLLLLPLVMVGVKGCAP